MALSAIIFRVRAIIREIKTRRVHESYLELIIILSGTISFTLNPELLVAYRNHPITYFAQQKPAKYVAILNRFLFHVKCEQRWIPFRDDAHSWNNRYIEFKFEHEFKIWNDFDLIFNLFYL